MQQFFVISYKACSDQSDAELPHKIEELFVMEQIIRLNLLKLNDNYPIELKNRLLWGRL